MSTKARMSRALGAVLLAAGALAASAPGVSASAGNHNPCTDLPAPAPPTVVSAVASGTGEPGQSTVSITVRWESDNFTNRTLITYANGVGLRTNLPFEGQHSCTLESTASSAQDAEVTTSSSNGAEVTTAGNSAVITWPICAAVEPAPAVQCVDERELEMRVGATINVRMGGVIIEPATPILISDYSKASNSVTVVAQNR